MPALRLQHTSVQVPMSELHRCEVFRCRLTGLGKVALPVITGGEHPVDHAALEVDTRLLDMAARCNRRAAPETTVIAISF